MNHSPEPLREEIHAAAERIIRAFAENDEEAYFGAFAPDATFCFYTDAEVHLDRESWRRGWRALTESGWRVVDCHSLETHVQTVGDGGVFFHVLSTTSEQDGERDTYLERETIVFERRDGKLVAMHEHLSPVPDAPETDADAEEAA